MRFLISIFVTCVVLHKSFAENCPTAKRWGFICLSETSTAICIYDGNEYVQISQNDCEDGTYCNEQYRNCSSNPSFMSNYADHFICSSQGFYPDLVDCGKFLYCPGTNVPAIPLSCSQGRMFSPTTGCCSLQRTIASCSRRQVMCSNEYEIRAWPENSNYFYFCRRAIPYQFLFPQIVKCPDNQIFDGLQCSIPNTITMQPNFSTSFPNMESTTTSPGGLQTCAVGTFTSDSLDCRKYWYCGMNGIWISYTCGPYSKFDITSKKCKIGNC